MKSRKGQAAIEYLMVFGLALLLSAPFIVRAQSSIIELKLGSSSVRMHNSLNKIESAVKTVDAAGEPARRTFQIELPDNVEDGRVTDHSVIYNLTTSAGTSQLSRSFNTTLGSSSDIPTEPGGHEITVFADSGEVIIEVV